MKLDTTASFSIILILLFSYLLGSIPFAYVVTRWKSGADIRDLGSKNAGATNVARTMGKIPGLIVLILDFAKGVTAVMLAHRWTESETWGAAAGFSAMLGHSFPVFLHFRGGKSVATGGGAFTILAPLAMLTSILVFILTVSFVRVVAIGSVVAAACFPFFAWIYGGSSGVVVWGGVSASLIILRHKQDLMEGFKDLGRKGDPRDA